MNLLLKKIRKSILKKTNALIVLQWLVSVSLLIVISYFFSVTESFLHISLKLSYFIFYLFFLSIIFLILTKNRHFITRLVIVVIFFLLTNGIVLFNSYTSPQLREFLRKFYSIKYGMTYQQVENIMQGYSKGTGLLLPELDDQNKPIVDENGTIKFSNREFVMESVEVYRPTDRIGDFNWGEVYFIDGKVVKTQFSPD